MNALKNQSEAARAMIAAMPMQSRIIVALLVVAIGVGLAFLVRGEIGDSHEPFLGGRSLNEEEMMAMEMAFSNAGLAQWRREGTRLMIPTDAKAEYHAAIQSSTRLPMSIRTAVEEAMDKASVFDSTDMRRSREKYAREKDLAAQVMAAPDIRLATVVHDRGQRSGLSRQALQTASVTVHPVGTEPLPRRRIRIIQEMIRAAYSGMSADDVVVTDMNGGKHLRHRRRRSGAEETKRDRTHGRTKSAQHLGRVPGENQSLRRHRPGDERGNNDAQI